ncbi:MAG TPA: type VII secretion protein EccCa [Micromonosporaceae bacterium]
MSTVVVRRAPRRPAPELPVGEIVIDQPPEIPEVVGGRWTQLLMLLPMLTGTLATAMMFAGKDGSAYNYVVGAVFGVSSLGMLATSFTGGGQPKKAEMAAARRDYLRHLAGLRRQVRDVVARQRDALYYRHPDPQSLWSTVDSFRLWERRPDDADFGVVRVGVGPQTLATPLVPPVTRPLDELEPTAAGALRRFLDTYTVVPDLPVALSVRGFARIQVTGSREPAAGLVRALLAHLVTFHAPDDLLIAVCAAPDRRAEWDWVKWLPHARHPRRRDAAGAVRLVGSSLAELETLLDDVVANRPRFSPGLPAGSGPHVVVVVDGGDVAGSRHLGADGGIDGVTVLDLDDRTPRLVDRSAIALAVADDGTLSSTTIDEVCEVGRADRFGAVEMAALARRLAPRRLAPAADGADAPLDTDPGFAALLGLGDPGAFEPTLAWRPLPDRDRLRVAIGVGVDGQPVELDLKESAQGGMGPHGLLIGATGSGKSELLRTLVLGLAATHDSASLNVVLIDFKGGATFASLDRLPHTAAVITNLEDELPLVDRMTDALNGELVRRQELLRRHGNFASLRDYEKARSTGASLPPLPVLLIICDEFTELLEKKPDFIDLFLQIGRLGRSLGVHLLLASQRLEEGRLRGLDTHLSYRIGLRTFSALESRSVLGVPDAYELPREPGHGFLKYGTEPLVRFKAAYVSGPYHAIGKATGGSSARGGAVVLPWTTEPVDTPVAVEEQQPAKPDDDGPTLLDVLVERLAGAGTPAHQVWLPPLSTAPLLDEVLGPVRTDPARGLCAGDPAWRGGLRVPVALVDKPFDQRRDLLWLALDGASGHVAVVGGPQSGKSTLLRTLILALSLTHTPREAQLYCLDFGGGSLVGLRELPHVGGVAGRLEAAAVRRTVGEVATLLSAREERFARHGIESMAAYRRQRTAGGAVPGGTADAVPGAAPGAVHDDDPFGDVFLVIDGWSTVRGEYDDLEKVITDIATRGLSYGIHVVAAASRWLDFRPAIRDLFGSRLELRLGDPTDSMVSRRAAANVPEASPGRGITSEGLHLLTAQPRVTGTDELVKAIAASWSGPCAPPVRLLPSVVPYQEIQDHGTGLALPIGVAEADLAPVAVDFATDPHFLLFGDAESGKTSFLRALAASIMRRHAPDQARIVLVDYRRTLLGQVEGEHVIGYCNSADSTARLAASVAEYMKRRTPGPDVTPAQLRDRSWWTGPECFVLVDDYDLVASSPSNPLLPLLDHLAQARDVGLHLVLTRRTGGAGRALYDPVIQRLRELSSPGVVLSGDREEGALLGNVRPTPMPPGRGWLVSRKGGVRLVQLGYLPTPEPV